MVALWILIGISSYIAMWFISARIGYIVWNWSYSFMDRPEPITAFFHALIWPLYLPITFGAAIYMKGFRDGNLGTSIENFAKFIVKGPKHHFRKKAGL